MKRLLSPMKARAASTVIFLSTLGALACTTGCSLLPEAKSDPTRFYILSTPAAGGTAPAASAPTVHLRSIELANYLRARPLVVRRGNNEIEFREFARWGEPLETGIGRVLREELLASGATGAVSSPGVRREQGNADYNLSVRVLTCEGSANGAVEFRAVWDLASAGTGANAPVSKHGEYRAADLRWDGKTEASLAAQLSQAVAGLAGEIAGALKK